MKNGTFTPEERERLSRLGAVLEARARQIVYSPKFKKECMRRYRAGERPGVIFASAGLPASLIGHKHIERAVHHWKHAEEQGSLGAEKAPSVRHASRIRTLKDEKRRTVERRRAIRRREAEKFEGQVYFVKSAFRYGTASRASAGRYPNTMRCDSGRFRRRTYPCRSGISRPAARRGTRPVAQRVRDRAPDGGPHAADPAFPSLAAGRGASVLLHRRAADRAPACFS